MAGVRLFGNGARVSRQKREGWHGATKQKIKKQMIILHIAAHNNCFFIINSHNFKNTTQQYNLKIKR